MSHLPVISGRECADALTRIGFRWSRQRGSHIILIRDTPITLVAVPDHKELDRGTLRAIIRQAGLGVDDFLALL
jgi:predicted RNA binding protein YcfA (HicA-like mRNA interferase family)